jgi:hypothetical protein
VALRLSGLQQNFVSTPGIRGVWIAVALKAKTGKRAVRYAGFANV